MPSVRLAINLKMKLIYNKIKTAKFSEGSVALMLVIIITTLTVVSAVAITLAGIDNTIAGYNIERSKESAVDIDACIEDALVRIASSTTITGSFTLNTTSVTCSSTVSGIDGGIKIVTSTATSTPQAGGTWTRRVILQVNVSTTPISIESYKDNLIP